MVVHEISVDIHELLLIEIGGGVVLEELEELEVVIPHPTIVEYTGEHDVS